MKPDIFKKVVDVARKQGPLTAYQAVKGRLNKPEPLGYSCAGIVMEASEGTGFKPGDRVAWQGSLYAHHSDVDFIPSQLTVRVPDNVDLKDAAYTTLGSIAMQGVRNSEVRIGETVVVIGLGLIGLLTVQILKAAGCRVFGIDIDENKVEIAKSMGMDAGAPRKHPGVEEQVLAFTDRNGADSVIITAATTSPDPLDLAGRIARKRARVVLVGVVGMEIPRDEFYLKEIEFVISCSYGPGRYDNEYEEMGHDYPIGYVRWTERRNMEAFLDLLSQKKIDLEKISTHEFPINEASKAYDIVQGNINENYLGIVLLYDRKKDLENKVIIKKGVPKTKGEIGIGMVGAGAFATSVLLASLKKIQGVRLVGLSAASGISSRSAAETYGFEYATTDYKKLLKDKNIDALVVATRNSLHAPIVKEAMESDKHVFVEKPLAISMEELEMLEKTHREHPGSIVQVGFNRRYAPITNNVKHLLKNRQGPLMMMYRVNAEHLPDNHWVYEDREGGSRFITELCHFIDFCKFLAGSEIKEHHFFTVEHPSLNRKRSLENTIMSMRFKDGSTAAIVYNTMADPGTSKEYIEIYSENSMIKITDFRMMEISQNGNTKTYKDRLRTEKGHKEELDEFVNNIKNGVDLFDDWVETTRITLVK
ncbi:MAG: bi-domain-containing oxidoreductase [Candidatus Thermoplasmatota archaeon]|nr:bi-domain-containing oxidoreductase [Candidatus Thermoplasmatota archaeon]